MFDFGSPLEWEISMAMMFVYRLSCLCAYFSFDVVERGSADDGEANQENIGLGIG